mmetsp:Transcript_9781/g.39794  ORF Transcript_9781/g.39794 Transcript_9781/m.39794 type:complete len:479 (-) Transcript_9781:1889-3325(-)
MTDRGYLELVDALSARLSKVEEALGLSTGFSKAAAPSTVAVAPAPSVQAFDAYCRDCLDPFVASCEALCSVEAHACASLVKRGWRAMRNYVAMASKCKKPSSYPQDCMTFLEPCREVMQEASQTIKRGEWEYHQKTISEGLQCLSWLVVEPAPCEFIENFIGGQDFWANKIRVAYKKTEPKHVAFCDMFKTLLVDLMQYVKEHHATGVTFNSDGHNIGAFASVGAVPPRAQPAAAAMRPPTFSDRPEAGATGGLGDIKAALSNPSTARLKKVTKDMQTWRAEYKGNASPAMASSKATNSNLWKQKIIKGPALCEFQERVMKWIVENQTDESGVITITLDPKNGVKHTVYICSCCEATVDIKGKCKSVAIDSCSKCNIIFDTAISSMEVVNCHSIKCQVRGTVPSVAIDKTDGILTYLSTASVHVTHFVTSKSSDMQVSFPNDEGEMVEAPIPEQFVHKAKLVGDKPQVTSDVSDLYSH